MTLHLRDVTLLTLADIEVLLDDEVSEGRDLDYKEELPKDSDEDKQEFRYDVSALANASGGVILYGIREKRDSEGQTTGVPDEIIPLKINPDSATLRLEHLLRSHIDPKIPGVQIRFIPCQGGHVGVVRVPRSWAGLHLVYHNKSYRFYSRTSKGKYILDATEIRNGFVTAQEGVERLRRFRHDRLTRIVADEGPAKLEEGPTAILHVFPLSLGDPSLRIDLSPTYTPSAFPPTLGGSIGFNSDYNYDGFVKTVLPEIDKASNYIQFFRNGAIEEVYGRLQDERSTVLRADWLEEASILSLTTCLSASREIGLTPPLFVCLSLFGVQGLSYGVDRIGGYRRGLRVHPFREPQYILPEILVHGFDEETQTILRPAFDRIWNAAGIKGSIFYDQDGKWIRPQ